MVYPTTDSHHPNTYQTEHTVTLLIWHNALSLCHATNNNNNDRQFKPCYSSFTNFPQMRQGNSSPETAACGLATGGLADGGFAVVAGGLVVSGDTFCLTAASCGGSGLKFSTSLFVQTTTSVSAAVASANSLCCMRQTFWQLNRPIQHF